MPTENQRFCTLLSSISIFLNLFLLHCYAATYNITSSNPLSQNEILISPAQVFELSFFHLDNSTNQYVGIWYKNIAPRTIAWVANRENPVIDSLASLKIGSDGNLKLVDGNEDVLSGQQLWQSFEHQVNTFLPGAAIEYDLETVERHVLPSCKSNNDQSPGDFVTYIVPQSPPQAFIWNGSVPYWRSREWNKLQFIGLPGMDSTYSRAISLVLTDQESGYFYVSLNTTERVMVILSEGTLKIMCWGKDTGCIAVAINNFSMANKLGQGGYGPVYKAWQLWSKGKELDLIDDKLADSLSSTEVKRCIQVALLCVQDHAENRPTMAAVISMLSSETELLQPKEAFFYVPQSIKI
ncbi:hypothetical protein SLEP1_g46162 [Rubroshorea leprosula]|uniref:Bulb-type lectin domain-containing protein n=1 Tax=Rubroshorea leprosula TaxID=152421 RepID=A0AAV5LLC8_9ROSI|nr:hypothetical protein SLEP1_g46162 [Rubroshorea leprosula]